jgi:2Fe-2S iron-sulfur cluster binding domain
VEEERLSVPLFRPYEKLISITIRGRKFAVPENQILLRAFQYLCPDTIPYGRYCWNEECQYCRVSVKRPGGEKIGQALSCKLMAEEGLEVQELSAELAWNLLKLLRPGAENASPQNSPATSESQSSSD